jgi:hypothetical protein
MAQVAPVVISACWAVSYRVPYLSCRSAATASRSASTPHAGGY